MQGKTKCAIYTRVSTDNQAKGVYNSCESQTEKIISFIKSQEKMSVYGEYSDPGYTGANLERPGLQKMLQDIRDSRFRGNDIGMVIVYKMDRLTRSPKDFYNLIELFEQYNVGFISVTERFDTSTPSGRLLRNIMLTFAQFERELASERVKDKMHQRAQKGMWNGGQTPFGYKTENKKLIINKSESIIISRIFDSYISSGSLFKVYNELRKNKLYYRSGNPFAKGTLFFILRNPLYYGQIRYADQIYQGIHKPIISEKIFRLAQKVHREKNFITRVYKKYPLAGLIKCNDCGSFMSPCHTNKKTQNKTKRYYYYRCTKTFKKDWNDCQTRQVSADRLEKYIFETIGRISQDKHYLDSLIFKLNYDNADNRIGLEPSGTYSKTASISAEIFAQTLQQFVKKLPSKKGIEKNLWVKKFIKAIVYSPEEIAITLYYKRDFPKNEQVSSASGRVGAAAGRIPEKGQKKYPRVPPRVFKVVSRLGRFKLQCSYSSHCLTLSPAFLHASSIQSDSGCYI